MKDDAASSFAAAGTTESAAATTHSTQTILIASTISGLCAGALGVVVGYPFDTLKTRLQASASGHVKPVPYTLQGLKSVYRGVFMPLASTGIMQSFNFAIYGAVKFHLEEIVQEGTMSYLQSVFLAGAVSGAVTSVLATPIQVVKVQYQTDNSMTLRKLKDKVCGGSKLPVVALYRGYWVTAVGDIIGRGLYLYTYEALKLYLATSSSSTSANARTAIMEGGEVSMRHKMLAAGFAGSFTWFALFPIDVIKTRVQAQICGPSGFHHLRRILLLGSSSGSTSNNSDSSSKWSVRYNMIGKMQVVRQLYRGCFYAVVRAAPVAASILPMYDFLNEALLQHL